MAEQLVLWPAGAEIFLAIAAMTLLVFGVFQGDGSARMVNALAVSSLGVAALFLFGHGPATVTGLHDLFISDLFSQLMKIMVLFGSALALILAQPFLERENIARPEYPVLVLFATLGMMLMISANDLLTAYIGLELQSLSLYVLAAYRRDNVRSSEAGLKYFVLGALASGLLLYGMSLVYGFSGTTHFPELAIVLNPEDPVSIGVIIGIVFICAGLAFKVSAVPFHMWTPDVYEGSPTPVTTLFAIAPKVAAIALFARLLAQPFIGMAEHWQEVLMFLAAASMVWGSVAAIGQTNIKRLMAYSSIAHIGFALVGLAGAAMPDPETGLMIANPAGVSGIVVYMATYIFMTAGVFAVILSMRQQDRPVESIDELAGLSRTSPLIALAMAVFMFSMAGIPPLAGFFGKFAVFLAAIEAGLYGLAILGMLASCVGCYYYLRIVKVMYFDEAREPLDKPFTAEANAVVAISAAVTFLFILATPVVFSAASAASAGL